MDRLLRKTLAAAIGVGLGVGVYACSSADPLPTVINNGEDAGGGAVGSSSGAAWSSSSGSSSGGTATTSSSSSSGAGSANGPAAGADAGETFSDLYSTVLGPTGPYNCATHHAAGAVDSFLDLSTASAAYTSLVGAPASGPKCGSGGTADSRVTPGSPGTSLLWLKVWTLPDGGIPAPCGVQMPKNPDGGVQPANPLSHADQLKVKSWIASGAQND